MSVRLRDCFLQLKDSTVVPWLAFFCKGRYLCFLVKFIFMANYPYCDNGSVKEIMRSPIRRNSSWWTGSYLLKCPYTFFADASLMCGLKYLWGTEHKTIMEDVRRRKFTVQWHGIPLPAFSLQRVRKRAPGDRSVSAVDNLASMGSIAGSILVLEEKMFKRNTTLPKTPVTIA